MIDPAGRAGAGERVLQLPVAELRAHPANPRAELGDLSELVASIAVHGVQQPLLVLRPLTGGGSWLVLDGHRRRVAARRAGLVTVPCLVRSARTAPGAVALMLTAALHRVGLSPLEEARAVRGLVDTGLTAAQAARQVGKSAAWVSGRLALLDLPADAQDLVAAGQLPAGEAVTLARQARRGAGGQVTVGQRCPTHLGTGHRLAGAAQARCDTAGHPGRGRVGRVACGACWEAAIRADAEDYPAAGEDTDAAAAGHAAAGDGGVAGG